MGKIVAIANGIAKVEWRVGSDLALSEIDERYDKIGDEIPEFRLVYNGGAKQYDELYLKFLSANSCNC